MAMTSSFAPVNSSVASGSNNKTEAATKTTSEATKAMNETNQKGEEDASIEMDEGQTKRQIAEKASDFASCTCEKVECNEAPEAVLRHKDEGKMTNV